MRPQKRMRSGATKNGSQVMIQKSSYFLSLGFLLICACSGPSYRADRTPENDASKTLPAISGIIIDVQPAVIEYDAERAQAIGATVGGIIATQATKNTDNAVRTAATVAGAAGGAVAADIVAKKALSPQGEELIIELADGEIVSVTQEPGTVGLSKGDLVWLVRGSTRTRVFPRSD